jgi:hypothetical protein
MYKEYKGRFICRLRGMMLMLQNLSILHLHQPEGLLMLMLMLWLLKLGC